MGLIEGRVKRVDEGLQIGRQLSNGFAHDNSSENRAGLLSLVQL